MSNLSLFLKLSALLEAFGTQKRIPTTPTRKTPIIGAMRPKNLGVTSRKLGTDIPDPLVKGQSLANFFRSKYRTGRRATTSTLAVQGRANSRQYFGGVKRAVGAPPQYSRLPYSRS